MKKLINDGSQKFWEYQYMNDIKDDYINMHGSKCTIKDYINHLHNVIIDFTEVLENNKNNTSWVYKQHFINQLNALKTVAKQLYLDNVSDVETGKKYTKTSTVNGFVFKVKEKYFPACSTGNNKIKGCNTMSEALNILYSCYVTEVKFKSMKGSVIIW